MVTAVILIVVAIVGAVVGVRATQNNSNNSADSRYPDYSKLNYMLVDTCKLVDVLVETRQKMLSQHRFWGLLF